MGPQADVGYSEVRGVHVEKTYIRVSNFLIVA